jgi:hypothetical protein
MFALCSNNPIMPASRPSSCRYRNRLMRDAAREDQLIGVRCNVCRRSVNYWANDLVKVVGPNHEVHVPPFPCSKCRTSEYLNVTCEVPSASKLQSLTVRRPVKKITKWIWRNERA